MHFPKGALTIHLGWIEVKHHQSGDHMDKKKSKLAIKILKISFNTVFYALIVLLVMFSIANMKLKEKNDIANILGNGFVSVLTDSMDGDQENSFKVEDLIFVKLLDDESRLQLEVGDIITYYNLEIEGLGIAGFITHRIIQVFELDGETFFVTRGDKVGAPDDQPIHNSEALALYQSKWSGAGQALKYLQTPAGFALFVILPVALMLIFEGVMLGRNIYVLNKQKMDELYAKDKEQAVVDLEVEKEKIRQQIIAELKKEQEEKNK